MHCRTPLLSLALFAIIAFVPLLAPAQSETKPLNVLLINGGCCHDYDAQGPVIKEIIESNLKAKVTVENTDSKKTNARFDVYENEDWAKGYDLIVHNECTANVTDRDYVKRILDAHRAGVPALNLHCAMHSYRWGNFKKAVELGGDNADWFEMIGLQSSGHGPGAPVEVTYTDVDHPITKGLRNWVTPAGELYNNIQVFDSAKVLANGAQTVNGKRSKDAAIMWTNTYGPEKTKIFSISVGHTSEEMKDENFADLLVRGVLWTTGNINDDGSAKNGLALTATTDTEKDTKKVVLLSDRGKTGHEHAHAAGNKVLAKALEESGLGFETAEYMNWPEDPKALDGADCVVFYCNGGKGHIVMKDLERFEELIKDGVGIVCMHYGVEVPKGKPGDIMLDATGGYFETHWSVNPHWTAKIESLPEHPITNGCEPWVQDDEWYFHMRFKPEGVTPILSAHPPRKTMARKDGPHSNNPHVRKAMDAGEIQHIAWAYERPGGGRGFGTTGGHYHATWNDDNWRTLMLNAIAWTSGVEIPEEGVPSKKNPVEEAKPKGK